MWLQQRIRLDRFKGLIERDGGMKTKPLPGMPVPHHVESDPCRILLHVVEAGEGGIEFFPRISWKAQRYDETVTWS